MNVRLNGIGDVTMLLYGKDVKEGDLVALCGNETVRKAQRGDSLCGKAVSVENGFVGVQVKGAMQVAYEGCLQLGRTSVEAGGDNRIVCTREGAAVLVVCVNESDSTAVIVL